MASLLLLWGVIVLAAVLRAFTGFGFGLAAVPVFSLFMPPTQAVVLSTSLTLAISLLTVRAYWGKYPVGDMRPMLLAAIVGTVCGVYLLASMTGDQFQLYIGVAVIIACIVLTFYRPGRVQAGSGLSGLAGLVAGLLNGAFAIPGPPVIIYAMATEPVAERSRSLLLTFFLFSSPIALASYTVAGFVTPVSPWLFLLAFPAMYVGDKVGYHLFQRYGTAFYRRIALLMLFGVGVGIILKAGL